MTLDEIVAAHKADERTFNINSATAHLHRALLIAWLDRALVIIEHSLTVSILTTAEARRKLLLEIEGEKK